MENVGLSQEEIMLSEEKYGDSVRISLRVGWIGFDGDEQSEKKLQLRQQCYKGKTKDCGIQSGRILQIKLKIGVECVI